MLRIFNIGLIFLVLALSGCQAVPEMHTNYYRVR